MNKCRVETDGLGPVKVPAEKYWGAQTQRALRHFRAGAGSDIMPREIIHALAIIKKAAAVVNADLGLLDARKARLIMRASDAVIAGRLDDQFPLVVWQSGSGTQTNMNVNEVIANRACELAGMPRGGKKPVHPNDDVNKSQSTNDIFPAAMHLAAVEALSGLLPALQRLATTLQGAVKKYGRVIKAGRTHLMDAVPLTLGQEISGWEAQLRGDMQNIKAALPGLYELALGGTAVGTGLGAHPRFAAAAVKKIAAITGHPFRPARNRFACLAAHDALVNAHGTLKTLACTLTKIANDVRLMASGPRTGIGEIQLPENEPGSSIMPGKQNPTQCEALTMVCAQVMGNDVAVGIGGMSGHFELNVFKPLIIHNFLRSASLLTRAACDFEEYCISGMKPDMGRMAELMGKSLMLVTALSPYIGYDRACEIAQKAHRENLTLRQAALATGYVSTKEFDAWVRPERMAGRRT